jgi:putative sterol carrier protein
VAISSPQDEDLMTKIVWFPLVGCGWVPAFVSVGFALAHSWSEYIQLRYHMGRSEPEPDPAATHGAVGFLVEFLPAFMDEEAAKSAKLTAVHTFTGPGGGSWTLTVAGGKGQITEGAAANPDMTITQSPETFELLRQGKLDPAAAMQSGAMQIQGMEHMATYGALFSPPSLDKDIPPMGGG